MKILLAGDWRFDIYESALASALSAVGHDVGPFRWHRYFDAVDDDGWFGQAAKGLQKRLREGPAVRRLNADLVREAADFGADAVFVFRGDVILPGTYRHLRERLPGVVLAGYNNDNPFSSGHPPHRFRHFISSLKELDVAFAYRPSNVDDFGKAGASRVALLPPWFVPEIDRPYELTAAEMDRFGCDVAFIGHYENDGRKEMLEAVAAAGHHVRLFGTDWDTTTLSPALHGAGPVVPVRGEDYRKALCGAKIALVFLSKLNVDCYTRRNFEIPATGTFMLSEYTPELAELFEPGRHADYFGDSEDLLAKVDAYLGDDGRRIAVARAGRERVVEAGHDVLSRAAFVAESLAAFRTARAA